MSQVDRTVLHGALESVPVFGQLPAAANMASECLVEDVLSKHLFDGGQKTWTPMEYIAFVYDVGEDGGEENTTYLLDTEIPAGTIIIGGIVVIADAFVAASGTPLVSLGTQEDTAIFLSGLDVCAENVNARVAVIPLYANAATWRLTPADYFITANVANASGALSKGRLYCYLSCFRNVIGGENSSSSSSSSSSSTGVSSSSSSASSSSPSSSSTSSPADD